MYSICDTMGMERFCLSGLSRDTEIFASGVTLCVRLTLSLRSRETGRNNRRLFCRKSRADPNEGQPPLKSAPDRLSFGGHDAMWSRAYSKATCAVVIARARVPSGR